MRLCRIFDAPWNCFQRAIGGSLGTGVPGVHGYLRLRAKARSVCFCVFLDSEGQDPRKRGRLHTARGGNLKGGDCTTEGEISWELRSDVLKGDRIVQRAILKGDRIGLRARAPAAREWTASSTSLNVPRRNYLATACTPKPRRPRIQVTMAQVSEVMMMIVA
eukprot:3043581-Rhodomonas_salina.1